MVTREKILAKILRGTSDANVAFSGLCRLLKGLGFEEHIPGDHYIFTKEGVDEILNLQPKGSKSKAYQVKQVRDIILKYRITLGEENEQI